MRKYLDVVKTWLREGQIWTWKTDKGSEFKGEAISGPGGVVEEMLKEKTFNVPNTRNSNPLPERAWGVIQLGIRTCHAHADAPECLWQWAARHCRLVYYYLATAADSPPQSPYEILHPDLGVADLAWAHTMFCDVVVALPERDVHGKISHRTTMGCHLGYNDRRRGHFVYCTKEQRLGTYKVLRWLEDNYDQCKAINADTPVEYHTLDDLQFGKETEAILPKLIRRSTPSERSIISEVSDSGIPTGGKNIMRLTWRTFWGRLPYSGYLRIPPPKWHTQ